jgi:hypothetical protein
LGNGTAAKLDSYDAPTGSTGSACYGCGYGSGAKQAWLDALPVAKTGCHTLPAAVGHGYPEDDYRLGNDGEAALAGPYGGYGYYDDYGYGYGSGGASWIGHGGAGGNWDALAVAVPHKSARFELAYDDAGRMVSEHLTVVQTQFSPTTPNTLTRKRYFAGPHLAADRVWNGGVELRALFFTRDAAGKLIQRVLQVRGQAAEIDRWQRDQQGRTVEHVREVQKQPSQVFGPLAKPTAVPPPVLQAQLARSFDADGETRDLRTWQPKSGQLAIHAVARHDTHGRLLELRTGDAQHDPHTVGRWTFDASGRETLHRVEFPGHLFGQDAYLAHVYDAAGKLTAVEQGQDPAVGATWKQTRVYGCR